MSECIVRIPELTLTLEADDPQITVELAAGGVGYPEFPGPYEVTPRVEAQLLETREQVMREDVTVHAIPYFETTNLSGGYTAIIGG